MKNYVKEIENFYLNLKKTGVSLSPQERKIILKWYQSNIPLKTVINTIKKEYSKFPVNKKKNFNLVIVDKALKEGKKSNRSKIYTPKHDKKQNKEKAVSSIWKSLPEDEKKKIINKVLLQIKDLRVSKKEKEEAIKILIRKYIEENYLE